MVASSHISIPPRYSACIANSIDLSLVYIITLVIAMHPPLEGLRVEWDDDRPDGSRL